MSYSVFGDKESPNPSLIPSELVTADRGDQRPVVTAALCESRPLTHYADNSRCRPLQRLELCIDIGLCAENCAGGIAVYSTIEN